MKRLYAIVLLVIATVMILVPVLTGCSTSPSSTAPSSSGARPIVSIEIAAGRPTAYWYAISHGLSTFINKDSTWLRATALATAGTTDDQKLLVDEPKRRTNTMIARSDFEVITLRDGADKGFVPKYIAPMALIPWPFVALDPSIKTINDFAGKKGALLRKGGTGWLIWEEFFKQAGLTEKIGMVNANLEAQVDAMRDGICQFGQVMPDFIWPNKYSLGANLEQLRAKGNIYFIGYDEKLIKSTWEHFDLHPILIKIPANALPNQPQEIICTGFEYSYWVDASMPDDVVYELTRILYKHAGEYAKFHAMGESMNQDFLCRSLVTTDAEHQTYYHPAAFKFYKDNNITLKSFF